LIFIWNNLKSSVSNSKAEWAVDLRTSQTDDAGLIAEPVYPNDDPAFYGPFSLINTDQGVRGFLHVVNDLCYWRASLLKLNRWLPGERASSNPIAAVDGALADLVKQGFASFVTAIAGALASFDWRTSSTPELDEPLRRAKLVFRGSSGYKELRTQLLEHLAEGDGDVAQAAKRLIA
jgi:hypothetical protein